MRKETWKKDKNNGYVQNFNTYLWIRAVISDLLQSDEWFTWYSISSVKRQIFFLFLFQMSSEHNDRLTHSLHIDSFFFFKRKRTWIPQQSGFYSAVSSIMTDAKGKKNSYRLFVFDFGNLLFRTFVWSNNRTGFFHFISHFTHIFIYFNDVIKLKFVENALTI